MEKLQRKEHNMIKIIKVILGKAILEECKIIEVRILEVDIVGMLPVVIYITNGIISNWGPFKQLK